MYKYYISQTGDPVPAKRKKKALYRIGQQLNTCLFGRFETFFCCDVCVSITLIFSPQQRSSIEQSQPFREPDGSRETAKIGPNKRAHVTTKKTSFVFQGVSKKAFFHLVGGAQHWHDGGRSGVVMCVVVVVVFV
jgi:hypothetical protein